MRFGLSHGLSLRSGRSCVRKSSLEKLFVSPSLHAMQARLGTKWAAIAREIPGRTEHAVKGRSKARMLFSCGSEPCKGIVRTSLPSIVHEASLVYAARARRVLRVTTSSSSCHLVETMAYAMHVFCKLLPSFHIFCLTGFFESFPFHPASSHGMCHGELSGAVYHRCKALF